MLKNESNNKNLSREVDICRSILSKSLGLMFSKIGKSLVFIFDKEKIISLHMFFVFYPIDVLFLDRNKKIVEIKENFKPFKFYLPKKRAKFVVELPYGIVKKTRTQIGDIISFK
ncbi:MAG: DUF192 domain-containing protein [Nanoarchaeota archaeon]|nr:DUF192 domain-containing protein [Nanoarchaeota archaeon]